MIHFRKNLCDLLTDSYLLLVTKLSAFNLGSQKYIIASRSQGALQKLTD